MLIKTEQMEELDGTSIVDMFELVESNIAQTASEVVEYNMQEKIDNTEKLTMPMSAILFSKPNIAGTVFLAVVGAILFTVTWSFYFHRPPFDYLFMSCRGFYGRLVFLTFYMLTILRLVHHAVLVIQMVFTEYPAKILDDFDRMWKLMEKRSNMVFSCYEEYTMTKATLPLKRKLLAFYDYIHMKYEIRDEDTLKIYRKNRQNFTKDQEFYATDFGPVFETFRKCYEEIDRLFVNYDPLIKALSICILVVAIITILISINGFASLFMGRSWLKNKKDAFKGKSLLDLTIINLKFCLKILLGCMALTCVFSLVLIYKSAHSHVTYVNIFRDKQYQFFDRIQIQQKDRIRSMREIIRTMRLEGGFTLSKIDSSAEYVREYNISIYMMNQFEQLKFDHITKYLNNELTKLENSTEPEQVKRKETLHDWIAAIPIEFALQKKIVETYETPSEYRTDDKKMQLKDFVLIHDIMKRNIEHRAILIVRDAERNAVLIVITQLMLTIFIMATISLLEFESQRDREFTDKVEFFTNNPIDRALYWFNI